MATLSSREHLDNITSIADDLRDSLDEFIELMESDDEPQFDLLRDIDSKLSDVLYYVEDKLEDSKERRSMLMESDDDAQFNLLRDREE